MMWIMSIAANNDKFSKWIAPWKVSIMGNCEHLEHMNGLMFEQVLDMDIFQSVFRVYRLKFIL